MGNLPRGIRNNNPGNIDRGSQWQGLSADQSGDPRFCVFDTPEHGIRALGKVLRTYFTKHGLNTAEGIVGRWAPPVENDTGSYARSVAAHLGVAVDARLDVLDPKVLTGLVEAIIKHENGQQPYAPEVIAEGVRRALA